MAGQRGDDAKQYQERLVSDALEEVERARQNLRSQG